MWHEARKHEKKLRVFIVDYRRRAERRREFYEKFKADPTQFMQVHGRPCKIHMDPQISAAAENSLMPWQADPEVKIDRCDARALLDRLPEYHPSSQDDRSASGGSVGDEETELNYERYRILIQNEISGTSEDKFLHQIHVEEQFGTPLGVKGNAVATKAQPKVPKAAIAYNYDSGPPVKQHQQQQQPANEEEEESDDDLDFDLLVNMQDLTGPQQNELNVSGVKYGMRQGDFMKFLNADLEEKEEQRLAKLAEEEKQTMSGRKARRERRAFKDRIILRKGYISPPSYAAKDTQKQEEEEASSSGSSRSRSASAEKITYITSFGGNENNDEKRSGNKSGLVFGPSLPPASSSKIKRRKLSKSPPRRRSYLSRSRSRDRSSVKKSRRRSSSSSSSDTASKRRYKRSRSRSRSRSKDRKKWASKRKSPSRSRSSSKSRRKNRKHKSSSSSSSRSRSRSRSRTPKKYKRRSRNHSRSYSKSPKGRRDRSPRRSSPARHSPKSNKRTASPAASNGEPSRLPSPPVKRYYDRAKALAKEDSSDDQLMPSSDSEEAETQKKYKSKASGHTSSGKTNTASTSKGPGSSSGAKLTPQERLKRRMQQALNRSLKEDKEAEKQRLEQREHERMAREESLRELSIKYRRRERVKRHQERRDSDSSYTSSRSRSRSSSRSRSRSPQRY